MNKRKRLYFSIAGGVAILVAIAAARRSGANKHRVIYATASAVVHDMGSTSLLSIGTVRASDFVSVGAQFSGQIRMMNVALGERVKKDQLIATIDPTPEINTLYTAEAARRTALAPSRSSEATLVQTCNAWKRRSAMVARNAAVQQDLETAQANYAAALATAQHSQFDSVRISVETAQESLAHTHVVVPDDGSVRNQAGAAVQLLSGTHVNSTCRNYLPL